MKKLTDKEKIYSYATILLIIDQFIKILIRSKLPLHNEIVIIPHFFSLYNITNTGAAFSIFQNHTFFLVIFTILVLLIIDKYLQNEPYFSKLSIASLSMILGGIIGNLIDRIIYHGVTDYLLFIFGSKSFPVFNFADILISCGISLYFVSMFIDSIKSKAIKKNSKNKDVDDKNIEDTKKVKDSVKTTTNNKVNKKSTNKKKNIKKRGENL